MKNITHQDTNENFNFQETGYSLEDNVDKLKTKLLATSLKQEMKSNNQ